MVEPVGPARRLEPVAEGVEEAFWLLPVSQWNGKQGQPPAVRKGEEALEIWGDRRCNIILWDSSRVIKLGKYRFLDTSEASLQFKFMNQKQNQTTWSYAFLQHFQLNMCRYRQSVEFHLSWVFERLWSWSLMVESKSFPKREVRAWGGERAVKGWSDQNNIKGILYFMNWVVFYKLNHISNAWWKVSHI